jgi:hypothetical protein
LGNLVILPPGGDPVLAGEGVIHISKLQPGSSLLLSSSAS